MEISKMLTISTAHISKDTARLLTEESNKAPFVVYPKGDYGFWVYCGSGVNDSAVTWSPADLAQCVEFALQHDCEWLCLDSDGEIRGDLPVCDY